MPSRPRSSPLRGLFLGHFIMELEVKFDGARKIIVQAGNGLHVGVSEEAQSTQPSPHS